MLRGMQTATRTWLGRAVLAVLFGLIAVSFAIWGIGDIFRGFGRSTAAKVGGTEITIEQFRTQYNERLQQLARRVGRPITPDQARALNLPSQMLGQMVAETALDENARQLRLGLSDAEIAKRITNDPNFRGLNGQFDRNRFEQLIRQAGYNEARFVAEQRRVTLRREIAETIAGGLNVPLVMLDLQNRYRNEERSIDFIALDRAQAGDIPTPTPEELSKYFDERKVLFRAPEFRKLDLLVLSPQDTSRWTEVSDADARKTYEDRRSRYVTPERREVQQIVFPNIEDARAAAQKIAGGATFEQIAAERGVKDADMNLGMVTKAGMLDSAVADAAFALEPGKVSEPVAGRFATVLLRTGKTEPEKVRPFEEVAGEIKRELATERARKEIADLQLKVEDERGAGQPLAEIAKKHNLAVRRIEAIDRSGRDPNGATVTAIPAGANFLAPAFASEVGVENDPVQTPDGGHVWFEVVGITPSRERPLSEVQDRVTERWREDQIAARLKTKAEELADKLKTSTVNEVAAAAGLKAQSAKGLKRGAVSDLVPARVVNDVFTTPKDGIGNSEGDGPTTRVVFRVTDINVPKLDPASPEAKQLENALRVAAYEDLVSQYVLQLQSDLGTTVNQAALNQVLSGGTQN
jgi:peptidyl-prolyl cis-trans isomerase D